MFVLKTLYVSNCGSLSVFVHVVAMGKAESVKKSILGGGVNPAGGSADKPVANISTSSKDTAVTFSKKRVNIVVHCLTQHYLKTK